MRSLCREICISLFILAPLLILGFDYDFRGQLSLQGTALYPSKKWDGNAGIQYIPQLTLNQSISDARFFDAEISLHGFQQTGEEITADNLGLYRLNARYATPQSELQVGLQKINFGPAQLLRSLMWFDRLNPTDPLKIAEGVWGLRYRYIFLNNANIWLWGLYGNDEPKGWEAYGSVKDKPELGARFQAPVPYGELALTAHYRSVENPEIDQQFAEKRLALDGRWDIVIGAWFEAVVQHQEIASPYHYTEMVTLGADYTFGLGNGLYILGEHMLNRLGNEFGAAEQDAQLSAVMASYPLGLFDTLSGMLFYSWEIDDWIQYFSWQRSYDRFVLNLSLFHFPDIPITLGTTMEAGYGLQFMLIYNH